MRLFSLLGLLAFVSCHGNFDELSLLQRTNGGGLIELSAEELLAEDEEDELELPEDAQHGVSPCVAAGTCLE